MQQHFSQKKLLEIEIKRKQQILTNKRFCYRLSMLALSKILIYEFWFDYVKPNYDEKAKLCYIDTDNIIIQ